MFLDSDDWISNRLVDYVLGAPKTDGFIVQHGYSYDSRTAALEVMRDFNTKCGSSFIARFRDDELPLSWEDEKSFFSSLKGHSKYAEISRAAGKKLSRTPFPAVIYRINHAESLQFQEKGRKSLKERKLVAPRKYRKIFDEFSIADEPTPPRCSLLNANWRSVKRWFGSLRRRSRIR